MEKFKLSEEIKIKDFLSTFNSGEDDYCFIKIEKTVIQIKKGDTFEDVLDNYNKRSKIQNLRSEKSLLSREVTGINNVIKRIDKVHPNNKDEILKIIRQVLKYQNIEIFEYRKFVDLFKEKGFLPIKSEEVDMKNLDEVYKFIFGQIIESFERGTIIHPKIKHLMNDLRRIEKESN